MHKKLFILFALFTLFITLVSSAPPITSVQSDMGFDVWATMDSTLPTGQDYEWELHVNNLTDGRPITSGIGCYFHLYAKNGSHKLELYDETVSHTFDYSFEVKGGNITRGEHIIKVGCNNSELGGGTEFLFYVNDYGEELTDAVSRSFNASMWFLMVLFVLALIGLFSFNNLTGKLACYWVAHLFFVLGTFSVWQFNAGYGIAYVGLAGVYKILFYVSIISFFPMVILSMAWIFYIALVNKTFQGFMERGLDEPTAMKKSKEKHKLW